MRKILLINEDEKTVSGLDTALLSEEQLKAAMACLATHEVVPQKRPAEPIPGYQKDWSKAWRMFLKAGITQEQRLPLPLHQ